MIYEAKEENGNIKLNGWVRWIGGILISAVFAMNAYTYSVVFPTVLANVVENDKASRKRDADLKDLIYDNKVTIQTVVAMKEDLFEIKSLLRRAAPYELKGK